MNDKAFEVRGPRTVAVKLEDVTDEELIDIAREQGLEELIDIDAFVASTGYHEARGAVYVVFQGTNYLTYTEEAFFECYTPAPADQLEEKSDGGDSLIDTGWRDRDMRVIALQQAVAISARGNAANTDSILKQAKQIEDYLVKGNTPEEQQTS